MADPARTPQVERLPKPTPGLPQQRVVEPALPFRPALVALVVVAPVARTVMALQAERMRHQPVVGAVVLHLADRPARTQISPTVGMVVTTRLPPEEARDQALRMWMAVQGLQPIRSAGPEVVVVRAVVPRPQTAARVRSGANGMQRTVLAAVEVDKVAATARLITLRT